MKTNPCRLTSKNFKVGDKIRLISKEQFKGENENWIENEKTNPQIGDVFTVQFDCSGGTWVTVEELLLSHPTQKFELEVANDL